jgi:hypothetical protein
MLTDNKLNEWAGWNRDILVVELDELALGPRQAALRKELNHPSTGPIMHLIGGVPLVSCERIEDDNEYFNRFLARLCGRLRMA